MKMGNVVVWIAGHVGYANSKTIAHANYSELGDWILLEKLGDELGGVADGKEIPGWSKVFLKHGDGEIEDEDDMSNYTSLKGGRIFEKSSIVLAAIVVDEIAQVAHLCLFPA
jgi:hypothetical protein